jgi:hypothetical protein
VGLTTNNDMPLRRPARIVQPPLVRERAAGANESETPLGGSIREGMPINHSETLLGRAVREGVPLNHSETLLGGAVREGITANHSETLLAGV